MPASRLECDPPPHSAIWVVLFYFPRSILSVSSSLRFYRTHSEFGSGGGNHCDLLKKTIACSGAVSLPVGSIRVYPLITIYIYNIYIKPLSPAVPLRSCSFFFFAGPRGEGNFSCRQKVLDLLAPHGLSALRTRCADRVQEVVFLRPSSQSQV